MSLPTPVRTGPVGLAAPSSMASSPSWERFLRIVPRPHFYAVLACASLLLFLAPERLPAQQQTAQLGHSGSSLPESPLPKTSSPEGRASVAGTVLDLSGATISGANVSLVHSDGTQSRNTVSDANGEFGFVKILPGSYLVVVNAKGFAPFTSVEFLATDQQLYELPDISLSVATASMEVTVRPPDLIAAEQIRAAEKQRLVGVVPNFYTSYIYDAAPLTWKQKYSLAVRGTFDPVAFIGVGFAAGIEQANNSFAGYGQGASGYAKRYAAKFVDGRSSDLLTHAVFPTLLHQDPRYYYQGSGSFKSRLIHAVGSAFVTRGDSGRTEPNYSYLLGDVSAAALSNLYYPQANRGAHLVFTNAAVGLAGRVGGNLIREFLSKRLTPNVTGDGRPPTF
jgi:Carboxypeptidase regulatory-like domain